MNRTLERPHLQLQQVKMELKVCSQTQCRLIAILQCRNFSPAMSAQGHKQTLKRTGPMSALPTKADMVQQGRDVRFVPQADISRRDFSS
jgi:hypothetical protein